MAEIRNELRPKAYILSGPPLSGKTTFALENQGSNFVVISKDEIASILIKGFYQFGASIDRRASRHFDALLSDAVYEKKDIIIDSSNVTEQEIKKLIKLLYDEYGYNVQIILFDVSWEQLRKRNLIRWFKGGKYIKKDILRAMYDSFYAIPWSNYAHWLTDIKDRYVATSGQIYVYLPCKRRRNIFQKIKEFFK